MPLLKVLIINLIENVYSQIIFDVNVLKFFSNCKKHQHSTTKHVFHIKIKKKHKTKFTRETQTKLGKTYLNMHDFIMPNPSKSHTKFHVPIIDIVSQNTCPKDTKSMPQNHMLNKNNNQTSFSFLIL
jgi:hypothetical protein